MEKKVQVRIMKQQHYRPEWTCGRFNKEKQVALMYNLIEGMSYFFKITPQK